MAETQANAQGSGNALTVKKNIGEDVIARVGELCNEGFRMPADFSYVNAVKMSILQLNDVKDKNGKPALQVCTQNSVATALFTMCTKGLNAALKQGYFIVRGDQLTFQESYFGKILQVKRIFPGWEPAPHTIREGDVFEFEVNPKTGHRILVKHTQTLESMDKDFVGAYVILPTQDGEGDLYVMTKKQIAAAWAKSSSTQHLTHKEFDEKMCCKTVVNSGCNSIINSTPSLNVGEDDYDDPNRQEVDDQSQPENETILIGGEGVNTDTGEVAPEAAPKGRRGRKPKADNSNIEETNYEEVPPKAPEAPAPEAPAPEAPAAQAAPESPSNEEW